ncbi:MAG: hypothetical protein Kow0047_31330 [Anaerolineae bacterium]
MRSVRRAMADRHAGPQGYLSTTIDSAAKEDAVGGQAMATAGLQRISTLCPVSPSKR